MKVTLVFSCCKGISKYHIGIIKTRTFKVPDTNCLRQPLTVLLCFGENIQGQGTVMDNRNKFSMISHISTSIHLHQTVDENSTV